jgi:hypothetical protein
MPKKGYKQTEEHKRKFRENHHRYWLGKKRPGMIGFWKGKKMSEEHKRKVSENNARYWKGKKRGARSEETKRKISETFKKKHINKGVSPWNKGKKLTEEHKTKISKGNKGKNHWNWQGWKSLEPYSIDWTETLKRSIRERDKYTCQLCGKLQGDIAFSVHHIDYNKENCNPDNLITLCRSCHQKTNINRSYWIKVFIKSSFTRG